MRLPSDKYIKSPLGFMREEFVVYVGGADPVDGGLPQSALLRLREGLAAKGYTFIYLPDLLSGIPGDLEHDFYPGGLPGVDEVYGRIRSQAPIGEAAGLLYRFAGLTYFHALRVTARRDIYACVDLFLSSLEARGAVCAREALRTSSGSGGRGSAPDGGWPDGDDDKSRAIGEALGRLYREYGVTLDDLDRFLELHVEPGRLGVTPDGRLFLLDVEGRPEVRMGTRERALYLFFLRNPDGVPFKDLSSHRDEILDIYASLSDRGDMGRLGMSVDKMVAPYSDDRDSLVSRIKRAFRELVGDRATQYYMIGGSGGQAHSIVLDRSLVLWNWHWEPAG